MDKFLEGRFSGYLTIVLNFLIVLSAAFEPGLEGLGLISMFTLGIAINQQLTGFLGGNYLRERAERENLANLVVISYSGTLLVHLLLLPVYLFFHPFGIQFLPEFFTISMMNSLFKNNLLLLLGKGKKGMVNLLGLFQVLMQILIFGLFIIKLDVNLYQYILALGISIFMGMAGSMGLVLNEMPRGPDRILRTLKRLLFPGFHNQLGGLLHLLSTRITYFFIQGYMNFTTLGEFALFVQFAEMVGTFKRPSATVAMVYDESSGVFEKKVRLSEKSLKWHIVHTVLVFIGFGLLVFVFSELFSWPAWQYPWLLLGIFLPGALALKAFAILEQYFGGTEYQLKHLKYTAFTFILALIFNLLSMGWTNLAYLGFIQTLVYFFLAFGLYFMVRKNFRIGI